MDVLEAMGKLEVGKNYAIKKVQGRHVMIKKECCSHKKEGFLFLESFIIDKELLEVLDVWKYTDFGGLPVEGWEVEDENKNIT